MLCTCIYFVEIGPYDGEDMPVPLNDLGVDSDEDQDIPDIGDHEAGVEKASPADVLVPPFARRGRLDSRYRMELGDQLIALVVEASIKPANMRDIQVDGKLLHMWRGMPHDMYNMILHVVGAMT